MMETIPTGIKLHQHSPIKTPKDLLDALPEIIENYSLLMAKPNFMGMTQRTHDDIKAEMEKVNGHKLKQITEFLGCKIEIWPDCDIPYLVIWIQKRPGIFAQ